MKIKNKVWILLMLFMLVACDNNIALTPQQISTKVKECEKFGLAAEVSVWTNYKGEGIRGYPQVIACVPRRDWK